MHPFLSDEKFQHSLGKREAVYCLASYSFLVQGIHIPYRNIKSESLHVYTLQVIYESLFFVEI